MIRPTIAREIASLPSDTQGAVLKKIMDEKCSSRETKNIVDSIKESPSNIEAILAEPAIRQTRPHPDFLSPNSDDAGSHSFGSESCPMCGQKVIVNWILRRTSWEGVEK